MKWKCFFCTQTLTKPDEISSNDDEDDNVDDVDVDETIINDDVGPSLSQLMAEARRERTQSRSVFSLVILETVILVSRPLETKILPS